MAESLNKSMQKRVKGKQSISSQVDITQTLPRIDEINGSHMLHLEEDSPANHTKTASHRLQNKNINLAPNDTSQIQYEEIRNTPTLNFLIHNPLVDDRSIDDMVVVNRNLANSSGRGGIRDDVDIYNLVDD